MVAQSDAYPSNAARQQCSSQDTREGESAGRTLHMPQEVVDMIIDELGSTYQRATLYACSLTCRAWVHRCRMHIHSAIRIDHTSHINRLIELYATPTSSLAPYVRSLSIDACVDGIPAKKHDWIDTSRPLLRALTRIERLSLDGIAWPDLELETREILLDHYGESIRDLWVATCDFRKASHLVALLEAFPRVQSVRMEGSSWEEPGWDKFDQTDTTLRLHWLDVGDLCNPPSLVARWARRHRAISIENLHFSWGSEDPDILGQLLRSAGDSVKLLSLTLDDTFGEWITGEDAKRTTQEILDLSHNRELRTFRFVARLEGCGPTDVSWISDLLSQLISPHLTLISIYMEMPSHGHLETVDWGKIDTALSGGRLRDLKTVDLCTSLQLVNPSSSGDGGVSQDSSSPVPLIELLPMLNKRGVLQITEW
ncbi:hypothetical protein WOLCODRAFT_146283 [Wolfiporia cocos MD-104 SS10]|uniref:F-box domain-containing protein n=1 Tax=Wolfiporia cocos (strain MD-104) TaxID=742152 RepID=A0A2H3J9K2_WOLCO|nr:hypothetical protein WOLCODRAFT_146283 [Wolfiporia cocos MD-104 SS10]